MPFKETTSKMSEMLQSLLKNLDKAGRGNKAASQRVRTGTVQLAKLAKIYRKESVQAEKKEDKALKKSKARKKR